MLTELNFKKLKWEGSVALTWSWELVYVEVDITSLNSLGYCILIVVRAVKAIRYVMPDFATTSLNSLCVSTYVYIWIPLNWNMIIQQLGGYLNFSFGSKCGFWQKSFLNMINCCYAGSKLFHYVTFLLYILQVDKRQFRPLLSVIALCVISLHKICSMLQNLHI